MDTITQGLLGATAAQLVLGHKLGHRAWIAGMAGGMLPDADVFLMPLADPALPWQLHRHFTHGIVVAPLIGLLAALALMLISKRMRAGGAKGVIGAGIAGALTHAPLDWCTTYGTKILWPFSMTNWTIDLYPIIDPVFTLVLLICVCASAKSRSRGGAFVALVFLVLYTGAALNQRAHATSAQESIAASRGHAMQYARVMPLPGSLLVWRSLYESDGTLHADIVRTSLDGHSRWKPGASAPLAHVREGTGKLPKGTGSARLLHVWSEFEAFAQGWITWDPEDERVLIDARMSAGTGFEPLWGVRIEDDGTLRWTTGRRDSSRIGALWNLILGHDKELVPVVRPGG